MSRNDDDMFVEHVIRAVVLLFNNNMIDWFDQITRGQ